MKANNPALDQRDTRSTSCSRSARTARGRPADAPLWSELAQNDEQRQILEVLSGDVAVGRPILTAPDVPAERVKALRQAFDETMRDPKFIAAAKKAGMYFNPLGGEELQRIVDRMSAPRRR